VTWKHYSLEQSAERFDRSQDLTIGIEEEFQILDAETLALANRFEELHTAARKRLGAFVRGELIASEIEVCTDKCSTMAQAESDLKEKRRLLAAAASETGLGLCAAGTHPFSDWKEQRILDTPHYRAVEERLRYCAWRNLTYGMHTHIGVRGHERMIRIYNSLRNFMPHLLALSANSPFAEGLYTYLHSTRAQIFTRSFPRCNIPGAFDGWKEYADLIDMYFATNSITEPTQVWWSLRPHPLLGTLEVRICDCQPEIADTVAVASLAVALVAKLGEMLDEGGRLPPPNSVNQLEENLWRATRYGLEGNLIDFENSHQVPTRDAIARIIDFTGDTHDRLGLTAYISHLSVILAKGNGAQKQIRVFEETGDVGAVTADAVARSRFDYTAARASS